VQSVYRLLDAEANVETVQIDAPHNYNKDSREAVYRFFAKRVLGADPQSPAFAEKGFTPEKLGDLLALHGRSLPANALSYDQIVEQWIAAAHQQNETPSAERLKLALAAEWPAKVIEERNGEKIVLSREGVGDRVAGIWIEGRLPAVVIVDPRGAEAGRALVEKGRAILLLTPFQTVESAAPRDRSHTHFLTFNKTDHAERVQDILTALAWLKPEGVRLVCTGDAAIWCTLAAAVSPVKIDLRADAADFQGTDQQWIERCFVPGIQRAGGWEAAKSLAAR
jgi:hypothetical protein